jgi:putative oxidoreductase
MMSASVTEVLKVIVFASVVFVWAVRYSNIVAEFQSYGYPDWLRDLVGIVKASLVILLLRESAELVKLGAAGIMVLMVAAMITHLRVKNPLAKMLPSTVLFALCAVIYFTTA